MARRGFFADLQRAATAVAREQARAEREAQRRHNAAVREAQRARKAEELAARAYERATEANRKQAAKEQKQAHLAAMKAQVESQNLELAEIYGELESLLAATLEVDDHIDLENLRVNVEHPPFGHHYLETPKPVPQSTPVPPEPTLELPVKPTGLKAIFGKKKHEALVAKTLAEHQEARVDWRQQVETIAAAHALQLAEHRQREDERLRDLEHHRAKYAEECATREQEVREQNLALDRFMADLGYGVAEAIHEYIGMVLANSTYPEHFPVRHDFTFAPESAELRLRVVVPNPDALPSIKTYRYTKSSDTITSASLSQKASRDLYASTIHQTALRSLHEVFEADRRALIGTIALEVGTEAASPATGQNTYIPFVSVGAEREAFLSFNLSGVVPSATLQHLGASISKNPSALVAADTKGVRRT